MMAKRFAAFQVRYGTAVDVPLLCSSIVKCSLLQEKGCRSRLQVVARRVGLWWFIPEGYVTSSFLLMG